MYDEQVAAPDVTAVRVALWCAIHVQTELPLKWLRTGSA
jgi:hypothetical protein